MPPPTQPDCGFHEPKRVIKIAADRGFSASGSSERDGTCLGGLLALALLLLLALATGGLLACLHLVHDEAGVALFTVPLEALEVGVIEFVVGL